jgi:Tfp pilus assembly protein PilE
VVRSRKQPPVRRGYTLVEMLFVQGVIVVLVTMSWPALRHSLSKSRLRNAARSVCVELAHARLESIESGNSHEFRYQPNTGRYEIRQNAVPLDEGTESPFLDASFSSDTVPLSAANDASGQQENLLHIGQLPEDIRFADLAGEEASLRDEDISHDDPANDIRKEDDGWSEPVIFYPSGTTTTTSFRIAGSRGFYVDVRLRGLTGVATIGELQRHEEAE